MKQKLNEMHKLDLNNNPAGGTTLATGNQTANDRKFACRENAIALTHLETALLWLEKRTRDREERGVEGTHAP